MEVRVEEAGEWTKRITITLPAEKVEEQWERIVADYRKRASVPGFRRGKVPPELLLRAFQGDMESDLRERLIPEAFGEALRERNLEPAVPIQLREVNLALGQPMVVEADVVVRPQFEVTGYRGLEVEQQIVEVDEAMIAEALETMRRNRAILETIDRPAADGDVVRATLEPIDVHGKKLPGGKREEVRLEVGSPTLLPEFKEAVSGISRAEARQVEVTYPDDFRDKDLAGKMRRFRLVAQEIQEKKLPELDDNFAKGIDPSLDLDGLRGKLRFRLESEELMQSMERLESEMVDRLLRANEIRVPEPMIEYSLHRIAEKAKEEKGRMDEEELRHVYRPIIERMHGRDLLFESLTRQEGLHLTQEEVDAQLDTMAEEEGVEVEVIRKKMEEADELRRMRESMQERKILDFLTTAAQVTRVRRPRVTN